jgi:lycopene cyclase domain-containing protein
MPDVPDHWQYAALLAGCLVITLPLELVLGARVYRSPRRLARALLPTLVVFVVWDLVGIARGHWSYAARYVTGVHLGSMPLEELLFFVVIPVCGLLTYEAVGRVLALAGRVRGSRDA